MDIPKVCSAPLDPTAPSLLTLPAEIRNRVNEYIFVRPEPILIHNADCYYNRGPYGCEEKSCTLLDERIRNSDGIEYSYQPKNKRCSKSLESWEMRSDAEKEDAQLFRHEASLGLGLLKSCRQIYHETASILYSKNTFVVSRVRDSHHRSAMKACESEDRHDYHQLSYTPIWLASLGSQIRRLKKVVVDIPDHPYAHHGGIPDLLPLLRMIWDGTLMRSVISFTHTGRRTEVHPGVIYPQNLVPTATRLTRAFDALVKDNTLHLRRYLSLRSLKSSLRISPYDICGEILFYPGLRSISRYFEIDEASGNAVWAAPEPITSPMYLPPQAKDLICRYVFTHVPSLRVVVNSLNPLGCCRGVFDVSLAFRNCFIETVRAYIPVTVELEAIAADMDYNALDPFRRFCLNVEALRERAGLISQLIEARIGMICNKEQETAEIAVLVRVPLARPTKPADICINIKGLFLWLEHNRCRDDIPLAIRLEYAKGEELQHETNNTTIGQLKMQIFLYFTDMLDQHPRGGEGGPELPELWIDGHANLVDLPSPYTGFRFSYTSWMKSGVGETNIRSVLEDIEARHGWDDRGMYCSDPCMCHAWRFLRPWAESVWRNKQPCIVKDEKSHD